LHLRDNSDHLLFEEIGADHSWVTDVASNTFQITLTSQPTPGNAISRIDQAMEFKTTGLGPGRYVQYANFPFVGAAGNPFGVGIGTTNPQYTLDVQGTGRFSGNLRVGGTATVLSLSNSATPLCIDGSNTLSICASLRKYKENIKSIDSAIEEVYDLRPVTYTWKENGRKEIGLIAEEVADVNPQLVTYNEDEDIQGLSTYGLISVLVKSVQELKDENEMLSKRIDELESKK